MLYSLFDKFIVNGILVEVRFINNQKAWVSPVDESEIEGKKYYSAVTFEVLDEQGLDRSGRKALVVNNTVSGAI